MSVHINEIALAVYRLMESGIAVDELSSSLAAYLLRERRTRDLEAILRRVRKLRSVDGIHEVVAESAHRLTESEVELVESIVRAIKPNPRNVIVSQRLDENAIGGVRIIGDTFAYDATLAATLQHLKIGAAL